MWVDVLATVWGPLEESNRRRFVIKGNDGAISLEQHLNGDYQ